MKTLIHLCCAPCLTGPLEALRAEDMDLAGFFYDPNIHPFLEFRKRIKAVHVLREFDDLPIEINDEYGLDLFVREVWNPDRHKRCENCYALRLRATAAHAKDMGFDAFTTTLLASLHQDHALVRQVGERAAQEAGVAFLYRDFRSLHDRSHELARQRMLYRQSYCGCCFSEYERYRDTTRELYRGPGPRSGRGKP